MTKKKSKHSLIVVALLVVFAAGVLLFDRRGSERRSEVVGQSITNASTLAPVDRITVEAVGEGISLQRDADKRWQISSIEQGDDGFPVDGTRLAQLYDDVVGARIQRVVRASESEFAELGLDYPTTVRFFAADKSLLAFDLGGQRDGGGIYIRDSERDRVLLVAPEFSVSPEYSNWELKTLLDVKPVEVAAVEFRNSDGNITARIVRDDTEADWELSGLKEGEVLNSSTIRAVARTLEGVNFNRRVDLSNAQASAALRRPVSVVATLFDGRVFEKRVGTIGEDSDARYFLQVTANGGPKEISTDAGAEVVMLNRLSENWAFEVSKHQADKALKVRADFIQSRESDVTTSN